jgi:hypothetical protein
LHSGFLYLKGFATDFPAFTMLLVGSCVVVLVKRSHPVPVATASVLAVQALFLVWVGGDWMGWYRFIAPFVPLMAALVGFAVVETVKTQRSWRRDLPAMTMVLLVVLTVPPARRTYGTAWEHDGMGALLRDVNVKVAGSLRTLTAPHDLVAVGDAGVIPYSSQRSIVDLHGLLDRHLASYHHNFSVTPHSDVDVGYVLSKKPACMVIITLGRRVDPSGATGTYPLYDKLLVDPRFRDDYAWVEDRQLIPNYVYQIWCRKDGSRRLLS